MIDHSNPPKKKMFRSRLTVLALERGVMSTILPENVSSSPQTFEGTVDGKEFFTILIIISIMVGLALLLCMCIFCLVRRFRKTRDEDANRVKGILVYPSLRRAQQPQLLHKEIHFSLPPMRSNSLSDLHDNEQDSDVDIETDSLMPMTENNQRSHSISCYGLGVIEPSLYKNALDLDDIKWPDGHIGRLWFSLRYEPATEKFIISLLKAMNLPSRTFGTVNSCDPYVRLHLMPDERRYLVSKQKKKTCNPYFDETLVFHVSPKDMADHYLKLTVVDGGRTKRRADIGHALYFLKDLEVGDGSIQQLFKLDLEKETAEIPSDIGELLISLVYNENLCRLTATVMEARRLKFQGDKHEAYVRLTLSQQHKSVKEKKTRVVCSMKESVATFTEGFNFKLTPAQMDNSSLAFHIFQSTPGYGRDKLMGKCVLGSYMFARGKALIHWNTTMASSMEPSQQWHDLCE